jgi:hypothetical protein
VENDYEEITQSTNRNIHFKSNINPVCQRYAGFMVMEQHYACNL